MSDLINRQRTIDILSAIRSKYNCFDAYERPYYNAICQAIKALSPAQEWIPVSERLPEDGQHVVIQMVNGNFATIFFSALGEKKHIVAWMPLPEPYKEDKDE